MVTEGAEHALDTVGTDGVRPENGPDLALRDAFVSGVDELL
jgi:hypothetical protein